MPFGQRPGNRTDRSLPLRCPDRTYCILGMILKCTVVDSAIESLNLRKVCTIISKYPEQVEEFIINDLHRSATEQKAFGHLYQEGAEGNDDCAYPK